MSALVTSLVSFEARERLVDSAGTQDFAELIRIAELDPKKHLRFADWSGVDFSGSDLRGFDFTGAKLIGCNFKEARIERARFDQALIDEAWPGAKLIRPAPICEKPVIGRCWPATGNGQKSPRRSIYRRASCFRMRPLRRRWSLFRRAGSGWDQRTMKASTPSAPSME